MEYVDNEFLEKFIGSDKGTITFETAKMMALELIEHRKNPAVWDDAPEWATVEEILFVGAGKNNSRNKKQYIRKLPKTTDRKIAEQKAASFVLNSEKVYINMELLTDFIESAIREAKETDKNNCSGETI